MLETVIIPLAEIYVPVKRRRTLDASKVEQIAENIMEVGQQMPIMIRRDKERYVLVNGMHRLEAVRALGEESIKAIIVSARVF